jgi:hypothetical protein
MRYFILITFFNILCSGCFSEEKSLSWENEPWLILDIGSACPTFNSKNTADYHGIGGEEHNGVTSIFIDDVKIKEFDFGGISIILNQFKLSDIRTIRVESSGDVELFFVLRYGDRQNQLEFFVDKNRITAKIKSFDYSINMAYQSILDQLESAERLESLIRFKAAMGPRAKN